MKAVALATMLVALAGAVQAQNRDLKGSLDTKVSLAKPGHAAAADSGVRVDRAGYQCLMASVSSGQSDNAADSARVVLIDSIAGTAAWQVVDSVTMDTVDNKTYKMGYKGTNRWVRLLARATGNAADTIAVNGIFVLGCKRSR